jgi:transcriptional regulator with XRE-family HTH domain
MKIPSDNPQCTRVVDKCKEEISTHRGFNAHYSLRMTNDDYKKEIGRRIAAARKSKDWSLADLASRSKLGRTAIGNYESGERMPGPAEINALALAMGVSGAFLMCLSDEVPHSEIEDLPPVFQEAVQLMIARYKEVASKLPVSVLQMFQRPTSENYAEWEQAIEQSYQMFAKSAIESDKESWDKSKKEAEKVLS